MMNRSPRAALVVGGLLLLAGFAANQKAESPPGIPRLTIEYSWALDEYAPKHVVPEVLSKAQLPLIEGIPVYRADLIANIPRFQEAWDQMAEGLLTTTVELAGQGFRRSEYSAAVFVNPRLPSMGTPLALNLISFLESSAADIPALEKPQPLFLFVALLHHELLHKFVDGILAERPSKLLADLDDEALAGLARPEMLRAHLHVFALQERVYQALELDEQLPWIRAQDALFGEEYTRAWELVRADGFGAQLLAELAR